MCWLLQSLLYRQCSGSIRYWDAARDSSMVSSSYHWFLYQILELWIPRKTNIGILNFWMQREIQATFFQKDFGEMPREKTGNFSHITDSKRFIIHLKFKLHTNYCRISKQYNPLFKFESKFKPLQLIWQSLSKAIPEDIQDNRCFWLQNQSPSPWGSTPAPLGQVGLESTNTGSFRVGGSRCG